MDIEELTKRIERLERDNAIMRDAVVQMRDILSGVMGTADADSAVVTGVLLAIASNPAVQESVKGVLEARMVCNLADNRNQPAFEAFDQRASVVVGLLEEAAAN